jgi:hypothetical protein
MRQDVVIILIKIIGGLNMNMRQFWQKVSNGDSIDFTLKIESFQLRKRHGRMTFSSGRSWRRVKKQCKMESKRDGSMVMFFLSEDNCFKADEMLDYGY